MKKERGAKNTLLENGYKEEDLENSDAVKNLVEMEDSIEKSTKLMFAQIQDDVKNGNIKTDDESKKSDEEKERKEYEEAMEDIMKHREKQHQEFLKKQEEE